MLLAYRLFKIGAAMHKIYWVLAILGLEVLSGIAMGYMGFPFGTQPLHLILATVLFGIQFYLVLEVDKLGQTHKTL